jgi:hypothetical protein
MYTAVQVVPHALAADALGSAMICWLAEANPAFSRSRGSPVDDIWNVSPMIRAAIWLARSP